MTLRAKLLALFIILGVLPIVALGVFNYVRSIEAVEDLIAERTASIAGRAAEEIADRYALRQSDLLLFAENAETQRLYRAHVVGDTVRERAAFALADRYLRDAWAILNSSYRWVEFQDRSGAVLYTLGVDRGARAAETEIGGSRLLDVISIDQPIRDVDDARELGTLVAAVRVQALLPSDALAAAFGRAGYSVIIDRSHGRVLFHPSRAHLRQATTALLGADGWNLDASTFDAESGRFSYEEDGSARVASFVSLASPDWTVVSSASLDEFAPPFARTRLMSTRNRYPVTTACNCCRRSRASRRLTRRAATEGTSIWSRADRSTCERRPAKTSVLWLSCALNASTFSLIEIIAPRFPQEVVMSIQITSSAFNEGQSIPARYTCDAEDVSPPLTWTHVPDEAKSLALICDDPDAPMGTWVHWVIYDIAPSLSVLPEGVPPSEVTDDGAKQGVNDFRRTGYGGPCPPPGKPHRYFFRLYALDIEPGLPAGASKADLLRVIEGHVLDEGQLMGRYQRG